MGECSRGMSGKAGIPLRSCWGLRGSAGEPRTMHGCGIATETPPLMTPVACMKGEWGGGGVVNVREPSSITRVSRAHRAALT